MIVHIKETVPGVVGNCVSGGAWTLAWLTETALPVIHVFSVLLGVAVSAATLVYYLRAIVRLKRVTAQRTARRGRRMAKVQKRGRR